jgi:hypothetical protein
VVLKHRPNAFVETNLEALLREGGVGMLVICGMMTNMCVDATVRAAKDMGFGCMVIHDACAAANLSFDGEDVSSAKVHAAFILGAVRYLCRGPLRRGLAQGDFGQGMIVVLAERHDQGEALLPAVTRSGNVVPLRCLQGITVESK